MVTVIVSVIATVYANETATVVVIVAVTDNVAAVTATGGL